MILSARSALEAKSLLIDIRRSAFSFPQCLKLPVHLWNSMSSIKPAGRGARRPRVAAAVEGTRCAARQLRPSSPGRTATGLGLAQRRAGSGAAAGAMGSHGSIEGELRADPSAAPAPGRQAVLKLEDFLPYQLNV